MGIARPVPAFVVPERHCRGESDGRVGRPLEDAMAERGVLPDDRPFRGVQRCRLVDDRIGHGDLADIVQAGGVAQQGRLPAIQPDQRTQYRAERTHDVLMGSQRRRADRLYGRQAALDTGRYVVHTKPLSECRIRFPVQNGEFFFHRRTIIDTNHRVCQTVRPERTGSGFRRLDFGARLRQRYRNTSGGVRHGVVEVGSQG